MGNINARRRRFRQAKPRPTSHRLPELNLTSQRTSRPVSYYFRFDNSSWACFTLNDETGEFGIQSDWGDFSYRWHTDALGKQPDGSRVTLTQFIGERAGAHYIIDKLGYNHPKCLENNVDEYATRQAMIAGLLKHNREHIPPKKGFYTEDRDLDKSKLIGHPSNPNPNHDNSFDLNELNCSSLDDLTESLERMDLQDIFQEPWDLIRLKKSFTHQLLVEKLIPFFKQWLKDNMLHPIPDDEKDHANCFIPITHQFDPQDCEGDGWYRCKKCGKYSKPIDPDPCNITIAEIKLDQPDQRTV